MGTPFRATRTVSATRFDPWRVEAPRMQQLEYFPDSERVCMCASIERTTDGCSSRSTLVLVEVAGTGGESHYETHANA